MANNAESIKQMVEQLYLDREKIGDITFIVESERIRAHRNVLAALSPKYKAQFYGPNPDQGEILIPTISAAAFKEFLQFFYKDRVNLTMDNIETVLDLAQQSLNDEFVDICIDFLKNVITTNSVCSVYRLAILYDIGPLRRDCEKLIATKTLDVFASYDFQQCNPDVLMYILKLNTLKCTEMEVFDICIAWAQADCFQKDLNDPNPKHLRESLGDCVYQIRFSSIDAEKFAVIHKSLEGFFTTDELVELLYITTKLKDFKSKIFNQTPRGKPKLCLEIFKGPQTWSSECNRFEHDLLTLKRRCVDIPQIDFDFICNNTIRLHGIVLGFQLKEITLDGISDKISVSVKYNDDSFAAFETTCEFYQSTTTKSESIIVFETPIERIIGFNCSLKLPALQLNYDLVLDDVVEVDNVKFILTGGWITRVLFDKMTSPLTDPRTRGRKRRN